ncbi:hypothetical protein SAMD00019534_045230, partial [Acytostelium subglobosum LB1]|uniref:hypothetical protein n=1 Tax=Acytostelium subglobosum LB1 TaxID=1410327 RepID=UPI0006451641
KRTNERMSSSDNSETCCCSAPGKVLITGGYLVLDREYDGTVFTINSRFYTTIKPIHAAPTQSFNITLSSPQFNSIQHYTVVYNVQQQQDVPTIVISPADPNTYRENKYVERTLLYTLIVASSLVGPEQFTTILSRGLYITILGGNDFYSQIPQLNQRGLPITFESLKSLPQFLPLTTTLDDLQKTGLGSSAALVSSLTAALLSHLKAATLNRDKTLLHNLAQLCHCVAQGKIGSGFDISSAVFGSQVYRRFSPSLIQDILAMLLQALLQEDFNSIKLDHYQPWDNQHTPMALPPGLHLLLADVSIGSNTPVMVKKVLDWRKAFPVESKQLWDDLHASNSAVKVSLTQLHSLHAQQSDKYMEVISKLESTPQAQWSELGGDVAKEVSNIRSSFYNIRTLMRKMGQLADVPLEPTEQTNLANDTMDIVGCVASGVPGAGGFDALFAIVLGDASSKAVRQCWMNWKQCQVLPLVLSEEPVGVILDTLPN